jgi:ABC-2 type transport system ATP-binding protein
MTLTQAQPVAATPHHDVVVACLGLSKVFRDFWLRNRVRAVDGLDLEVRRGEVFGLLGPNGSGKSTTIKMILGLLHPSAGQVLVFGKRPDDVATKRQIGYLPEESYLYRFLNARETLDYYARLFHLPRAQRHRRIDMLLDMVGLAAVQRRPVGEYSKGMQRRIGLAQALINDPAFLILDEPTSGLDPVGARQIKDLIHELARRGKTILLCSHLLADCEDVCDRVGIMFGGKWAQRPQGGPAIGPVADLLARQDQLLICTDPLDQPTLDLVRQLLEKHGRHITRVDKPRGDLESFFLETVRQAQAAGTMTSGAVSGGKLADFLVGSPVQAEPQAVIEQLVQVPAATAPVPAPAPTPPAEPAADDQVLAELIAKCRIKPAPPPPADLHGAPDAAAPATTGVSGKSGGPGGPTGTEDAEHAPPTPEELSLIDSLVTTNWSRREMPPDTGKPTDQPGSPGSPPSLAADPPKASQPAGPEAPFAGFHQAVSNVEPPEPPAPDQADKE